jgi:hypothetical protein
MIKALSAVALGAFVAAGTVLLGFRLFRDQHLRGLLRLDQKIASGIPMSLRRVANILNTDAMLFQEFCDRLSQYG